MLSTQQIPTFQIKNKKIIEIKKKNNYAWKKCLQVLIIDNSNFSFNFSNVYNYSL